MTHGMAHVLASDAHGPSGPRREPLSAGVAEARVLAGAYANWMVEDAPAAIWLESHFHHDPRCRALCGVRCASG